MVKRILGANIVIYYESDVSLTEKNVIILSSFKIYFVTLQD